MLIVVERRETFHYYYPMGVHPPGDLTVTEQQLAENKKATSNMLKAIEMGIITEATRSRMVELETENSKLTAQLSAAKRDVVKINREDLIDELHILRSKDIHDREVQAELFKDFLVAAYIYDDNRLKLVFSFMGKDNSVEIPLETGEDPPDGEDSPDAKMFVLTPDCSAKKNGQMNFIRLSILFCRNIARPPCLVGVWHHADALP